MRGKTTHEVFPLHHSTKLVQLAVPHMARALCFWIHTSLCLTLCHSRKRVDLPFKAGVLMIPGAESSSQSPEMSA
eukprot:6243951-Amphidinium_carterae.1